MQPHEYDLTPGPDPLLSPSELHTPKCMLMTARSILLQRWVTPRRKDIAALVVEGYTRESAHKALQRTRNLLEASAFLRAHLEREVWIRDFRELHGYRRVPSELALTRFRDPDTAFAYLKHWEHTVFHPLCPFCHRQLEALGPAGEERRQAIIAATERAANEQVDYERVTPWIDGQSRWGKEGEYEKGHVRRRLRRNRRADFTRWLSAAEPTFFSIAEVGAERGPAQPVAASDEAGGTAQELRTVCEPILSVYLCGVGA
ncbi:hypothetical protein A1Q1_03283 [Trichosporon asahii var. asahii CBS 2479]|uniref:Uncharacterized protein n=1 Tax=Trichosporon asahii var. asahii (strain ATCC 90039 / CBS 2479 / JCM 2466 / KCTC 7840 / NBRC 103889/ NCYC 2677 / UAMH 7654) TaxID=1186058 RepID=J6EYA0_TRIAS|nr:hypothetical protein A1Q1_03283 [Trichosporon asahii var. asahii CBS 2479]EJT47822.1 hypothetical protein A1Q1_03283 [Trichosporon asahii var. asahii CBS 2479]